MPVVGGGLPQQGPGGGSHLSHMMQQQQVQMPPGAGQVPPQGRMQVMQGGMMGQPVVGNPMQQGPVSRNV